VPEVKHYIDKSAYLTFVQQNRAVGNARDMEIRETLERLVKRCEESERRMEEQERLLKRCMETTRPIQEFPLEEANDSENNRTQNTSRNTKDEVSHCRDPYGGDLKLDLQLIRKESQDSNLRVLYRVFKHLYDISVEEYQYQLENAPDEITVALNLRANMKVHPRWNRNVSKKRRDAKPLLIGLCDGIIDSWLESLSQSTPWPNRETREKFKRLTDRWSDVNK
jgi:hypothetical protein